jgi:phenylpyruvate tautomerase PptA (4-oxalocrotonate tautomerase family)
MPILEIEIVASGKDDSLPSDLIQSLADIASQVFETPRGTTWVKVQVIPIAHYAEDHGRPAGVHPVFVSVLKANVPEKNDLEREITRLTSAIAGVLNRPETNIHIFTSQMRQEEQHLGVGW